MNTAVRKLHKYSRQGVMNMSDEESLRLEADLLKRRMETYTSLTERLSEDEVQIERAKKDLEDRYDTAHQRVQEIERKLGESCPDEDDLV